MVVNSPVVASELFEKRSSIYSDRSELPMLKDLYVGQVSRESANIHRCIEWVGTGLHPFCATGNAGEVSAECFIKSFIPWRQHNITQFNSTRRGSFIPSVLSNKRLMGPSVLLQRLSETPKDFVEHVRHTSGAIIMEACYLLHHPNRIF